MPQPMPNKAAPPIRRRVDRRGGGRVELFGRDRGRATPHDDQAIAIGSIAPPMTNAKVGSHAPATSRNARTRAGSIMPETARPAPNSVPLSERNEVLAHHSTTPARRMIVTVTMPVAMNVPVAAIDRGDRRDMPQTP